MAASWRIYAGMGATSSERVALILFGPIHRLARSKRYLDTSKSQTISLERSVVAFRFRNQAASKLLFGVPPWSLGVPFAACVVLAAAWGRPLGWILVLLIAAALIAAVFVAVHHAEVVAHRVGEPFGTLILALAVTVIEVALIVSIMLSGGTAANALARDTVFATVMIVCNGVVGLCLLMGATRHHVLVFRVEGTSPALSVLIALTTLTLILPYPHGYGGLSSNAGSRFAAIGDTGYTFPTMPCTGCSTAALRLLVSRR